MTTQAELQFQSAPVITDGRSVLLSGQYTTPPGFNPHPSSLTGDPQLATGVRRYVYVSIRTRHH